MESESVANKCRTCLKESYKMNALTMTVKGCDPITTYGELLRESTILESLTDYEYLMPQNICIPCCQELKKASSFLRRVRLCNKKLMNLINKHLPGMVQSENECPTTSEFGNLTERNGNEKNEIYKRRDFTALPLDCAQTTGNMQKITCFQIRTEDYVEHINVVEPVTNIGEELQNSAYEHFEILEDNTDMENYANSDLNRNSQVPDSDETLSAMEEESQSNPKESSNIKPRKKRRKENNEWLRCSECPRKFSHEHHYLYHLKNAHGIVKAKSKKSKSNKVHSYIKCNLCDHKAINANRLRLHTRMEHGNDEEKFKCILCSFKHVHKSVLEGHIRRVHNKFK